MDPSFNHRQIAPIAVSTNRVGADWEFRSCAYATRQMQKIERR
ncbi:hypothetical protein sync_1487 [Synechococcus sp. CC9311]|nr:hypothetical protein sync_1487 [Synechococcus sp. CC9311]